ncbi:hypothetical protein [Sphingomonas sp. SAFR-052]|uniref:hypothetical protein n=1 Tax=Sphingomonas sp. SAFR-052 TaxID=3436867 RepID=UPI003F7F5A04
MAAKRLFLSFGVIVALVILAGVIWYAIDRPKVLELACKAGLPNFSRPEGIPSNAVHCVILGELETINGVVFSSDHGSSLAIPGATVPISLWFGDFPSSLSKQIRRSWAEKCVNGASVQLVGWRTRTAGSYGETGFATEQFYVDHVTAVGPLPKWILVDIDKHARYCKTLQSYL